MTESIYTPRGAVDALLSSPSQPNKRMCTRVPYRGYVISISMDSSHLDGDLFRSDLRVFDSKQRDVTDLVFPECAGQTVAADAEALKEAFASIDELTFEPA